MLTGTRGHQAVKGYQRDITPFCVVCGKGIDHDQPAYQLNEGTTQTVTPTFLPVSSIGLLHASCLAEILEQVYQTLLPDRLERVIPVKQRLPRLNLKTPAQVPVRTQIEAPAQWKRPVIVDDGRLLLSKRARDTLSLSINGWDR